MYQSFVFLEIRVLILSDKKAFCSCAAGSAAGTCPICMRVPGNHPVLKKQVAHDAYRLAQSLDCKLIAKAPYEYPSGMPVLPPEYRLCGASVKIAENGVLDIEFHKHRKQIDILEIRIEEDAGRLIHADGKAFMDYGTAGMPSIRIRTGNNLELGEEAEMFLTELSSRMRYIGLLTDSDTSHKIRCNAYTASTEIPNTPQHYVKLRNLNSFNFVRKAVNEDLRRQEQLLRQGQPLISESRLWNARLERTEPYKTRDFIDHVQVAPLTEKYFYTAPESLIRNVLKNAPENQQARKSRYVQVFGLSMPAAQALCGEAQFAAFFDSVVHLGIDPKQAATGMLSDIAALLKRGNTSIAATGLSPDYYVQILRLSQNGTINHTIVRKLLASIILEHADPAKLLAQKEWTTISDDTTLRTLVQAVLADYPDEAAQLKTGTMKYLEILCGAVMKKTEGLADQERVKSIIKEELSISIIYILYTGTLIAKRGGERKEGDKNIAFSTLIESEGITSQLCSENLFPDGDTPAEGSPAYWAMLIHAICGKIASGTARGIVLPCDATSLVYTAPLLYWLFAASPIPIVLAACMPASADMEPDHTEKTLLDAVSLAEHKVRGVYVSCCGRILSPLNVRYTGLQDCGYTNWNMAVPFFEGEGLFTDYEGSDRLVFESLLSEAADRMFLVKNYPGIKQEYLFPLLKHDIHTFFLELYEDAASSKVFAASLKEWVKRGRKQQCRFFCTSQQGGSSWKYRQVHSDEIPDGEEAVVSLGMLTTETAIALYYAASLVCDTEEELTQIMEAAVFLGQKSLTLTHRAEAATPSTNKEMLQ